MKKNLLIVAAGLAVLALVMLAHATPTILAGAPANVTGTVGSPVTSNFPVIAAFTFPPSLQQYYITHGALTATTDIKVNVQLYMFGQVSNTAVTAFTWYPTTTNAATEYIFAGQVGATNYTYPQVTTTNSQNFYIGYGQ
jgi:hypothetical protein